MSQLTNLANIRSSKINAITNSKSVCDVTAVMTTAIALAVSTSAAMADDGRHIPRVCSNTANLAYNACNSELKDDYWIGKANCLNVMDKETRVSCMEEVKEEAYDSRMLCKSQRVARKELCDQLGEAAYDVSSLWNPTQFIDPLKIGSDYPPNPYFPLLPGTRVLVGGDEIITINVTTKTKSIAGITCLVVNDLVSENGVVLEDTDDWYAQDIDGNVWYCGEISKNYELNPDDNPAEPELVDIEGSWKAFQDGAQPGILMKANPQVGDVYRQEISLGDAEDAAEVIATSADGLLLGDECAEDGEAIAELIDTLCDNDCLVTKDFSPLEPGGFEHKYYAFHEGLILEINNEGECTVVADEE